MLRGIDATMSSILPPTVRVRKGCWTRHEPRVADMITHAQALLSIPLPAEANPEATSPFTSKVCIRSIDRLTASTLQPPKMARQVSPARCMSKRRADQTKPSHGHSIDCHKPYFFIHSLSSRNPVLRVKHPDLAFDAKQHRHLQGSGHCLHPRVDDRDVG